MRTWLRKVRAILGLGTIWGGVGAVIGAELGGVVGLLTGTLPAALLVGTLVPGIAVLVLGSGFAAVLSAMEGRRTLDELTPARAGLWGGAVGAAAPVAGFLLWTALSVPTPLPLFVAASVSYGLLTSVLAATTVVIAKRAPDRELASASVLDSRRGITTIE